MITKEQLKLYLALDGDIDWYQRTEKKLRPAHSLSNDEWQLLDDLVQRITIRNHGMESEKFAAETDTLLKNTFDQEETLELIRNHGLKRGGQKMLWWKLW